ncbi:hypothetical protein YC2023_110229 [Brassica napus]
MTTRRRSHKKKKWESEDRVGGSSASTEEEIAGKTETNEDKNVVDKMHHYLSINHTQNVVALKKNNRRRGVRKEKVSALVRRKVVNMKPKVFHVSRGP